jgi:photosystem II stability/assembly factor-like uncharacterized protein
MRGILRLFLIAPIFAIVSIAHGQWKPLNGPVGFSAVGALVQDSALVISTTHGLFRSTDHGASWDSLPNLSRFPQDFLLHQGEVYVIFEGDVVRYDKSLLKWIAVDVPPDSRIGRATAFGNSLYLALEGGKILRTADKGLHWSTVYSPPAAATIFQLAVDSLGILAATETGFIRSGDDGAHWETGAMPIMAGKPGDLVIKGANVFFCAGDSLVRSSDGGRTWKTSLALGRSFWLNGLSRVGNALFVAKVDSSFRIALLRSDDDGANWREISRYFNVQRGLEIHKFIGLGSDLFAASFGGMFRSSDQGLTWSPRNKGISLSDFKSLVVKPDGSWLGFARWGMYRSSDQGDTWNWVEDTTSPIARKSPPFLFAKDSTLFTATEEGVFLRSSDDGRHWSAVPIQNAVYDAEGIASLGPDLFLTGGQGGVWKSADKGGTWVPRADGLPQTPLHGLAVCHGALFGAGDSSLYRYQPASGAWERIASLPPNPYRFFSDDASLYLSGWSGPSFRSADEGRTWKTLGGLPDSIPVTCAAAYGNAAVVGAKIAENSSVRAAFSVDQGIHWTALDDGLPYTEMFFLRVEGDSLLASTLRGLYKRPLKDFSGLGIKAASGRPGLRGDPVRGKSGRGKVIWLIPGNGNQEPLKVDSQGKRLP